MKGHIIPKLCHVEKFVPTLGVGSGETLKVSLQTPIDHLRLSICLRVVCCAIFQRCTLDVEQLFPKRAQKERILIEDDRFGNAMEYTDFDGETCCQLRCGAVGGERQEVDVFGPYFSVSMYLPC